LRILLKPILLNGPVPNTNVVNASNALGAPDGLHAGFHDNNGSATANEIGTYSGFGSGDINTYSSASLAALLGISQTQLSQGDLVAFERNGTPGYSFEGCDWVFDDGTNSATLSYTQGVPDPMIVALGNISNGNYANFFGFTNSHGSTGDYAFILFDIDGNSAVNPFASNFSVSLSAMGVAHTSPDPDAIGRWGVDPVPAPGALLLGSLGLSFAGWRLRRKNA